MCPFISQRQHGVKPIVSYFKTRSASAFSAGLETTQHSKKSSVGKKPK